MKLIHPLWHVAMLGAMGAAVPVFHFSEALGAVITALFVLGVTLLHPLNGVTFLFLSVPFFLGEAYKSPAFLLLPGMVFVVIVLGVWAGLRDGRAWVWPHRGILLFYVASLVLAVPLDLKELWEDLWVFPPADLIAFVLHGIPAVSHLNPLPVFVMALLGVGLYVVVVNLHPPGELIRRTIVAMALVYGGLALLGIVKELGAIPYRGGYLSLSFAQYVTVGNHPRRLTGIAWNPDYFAQYLVYGAPWMLVLLGRPVWRERVGGLALVPAALALALTFQRGAYLGFLVELSLMALYGVWVHRQAKEGMSWARPWIFATLLGFLTLGVLALDAMALGGAVLARFRAIWELGDANRAHLWRVALSMVEDQPLLGVGTGRFAYFFPHYSSLTPREFGPFWGTAHSLYLEVFTEGGGIGLFALALLIGAIFGDGLRGLRAERSPSVTLLGGAMISLGGWIFYGTVQHTFYIWSLQMYFWLLAALITSLAAVASPSPPRAPRHRPLIVGLVACLVLAGAWRGTSIASRPRALGYEAGFFKWERQPDQTPARWTGRRAAAVLPAGGPTLVLTASAPLPGVDHRPQALTAWVDGGPSASLLLPGREWVQFRLPVNRPQGHPVLLRLQAGYALSPKQIGASSDDRTLGVLMKPPRWE